MTKGDSGHGEQALTWSQQLLWTGQQLHPNAPLYNMVLAFDVVGSFSPELFERAFQSVVDRADALRSGVTAPNGQPILRVRAPFQAEVQHVDLSSEPNPERAADRWIQERARQGFAPGAVLFDCAVLRLKSDHHVWYLNQHHLITDAWSTGLVFRYVEDTYRRLRDKSPDSPPALPQYSDFAVRPTTSSGSRRLELARAHWDTYKRNPLARTSLYGRSQPKAQGHSTRTERTTVALGRERSAALRALAATPQARGLTDHASRFNVFAALVLGFGARVSGQREVTLGAPAHNRLTAPFRNTVGVFIELFPVRAEVDPEAPFISLLETVRKEASSFMRHALPGASDGALNRSVNVVLNYINATFRDFAGLNTRSRWIHSGHGDASHDLRVQVHDFDDEGTFVVHLDMAVDRFDDAQRALLGRHFLAFVDSVLAQPQAALRDLSLVDAAERVTLLTQFSGAPEAERDLADPPASVLERVRERVVAHPERIAIVSGSTRWSYEDLYQRVVRIARALEPFDVSGRPVALAVPRSADAVAAILGILEAGAAYVPLDPTGPPERTQHMLDAVRPAVTLVADRGDLPGDLPVLTLDHALDATEAGLDPSRWIETKACPQPTDLAYTLFTSGSTGRPKGVAVEHAALAHYADWAAREYLANGARAWALFTPLTFDLTVTSIFAPLVAGGSILVYEDRGEAVDAAVLDVFMDDAVDVVKLTPSHLALVLERARATQRIRTLVLGGEELSTELARAAQSMLGPQGRVINEYGPTETTVACAWHEFDPDRDGARSVPIGRPIPGAHLSLVDDSGRLVPTGAVGEIMIGGRGVARGYLSASQTADRFGADPVQPDARAYTSGDLGRWRSDGTLEFLGRSDRQVKIHGVRIEPAEIEAALAEHSGLTGCAVVATRPLERLKATHVPTAAGATPVDRCSQCGIPADHPEVDVRDDGVCSLCAAFGGYRERASKYFGSMQELERILHDRGVAEPGPYDCLLLLSGGKDSSYALYQLVQMGLRVFTVTLDNGYISDGAKANVRRVTDELGVPHAFLTSDAMNDVFVDSLERFSNVCQGCFKTMYTLAFNFALERGIPSIVTGLSRGQFFETRLTEELFLGAPRSRKGLELVVLDARKAYHRSDDLVNRVLDTDRFKADEPFDQVAFVDFYRYCDVSLDDMFAFLGEHAPWIRPDDTGRSTNCLINDVGIYVHKLEKGFHNYALPYSWDVRLGHKDREAALDELDDDIDTERVQQILSEIGYTPKTTTGGTGADPRLTAFVTGPAGDRSAELRGFLGTRLPSFMIPTRFVRLDTLPTTLHGKIDMGALERLASARSGVLQSEVGSSEGARASTPTETSVAELWSTALGFQVANVEANFFDLGGDSITAIRIAARGAAAGLPLTPNHLFRHQTVRELAQAIDASGPSDVAGAGDGSGAPDTGADGSASLDARTLDQVAALLRKADRGGARGGP